MCWLGINIKKYTLLFHSQYTCKWSCADRAYFVCLYFVYLSICVLWKKVCFPVSLMSMSFFSSFFFFLASNSWKFGKNFVTTFLLLLLFSLFFFFCHWLVGSHLFFSSDLRTISQIIPVLHQLAFQTLYKVSRAVAMSALDEYISVWKSVIFLLHP